MRRYQVIIIVIAALAAGYVTLGYVPARASLLFGPPARELTISQRVQYSARLLAYGDALFNPLDSGAAEQAFHIDSSESVASVAARLEQDRLISRAQIFYDYVVYTGLDHGIQAGDYKLSASLSVVDIARRLQDATSDEITLGILPGWRMEEIAASLRTSGLDIAPDAFLSAAQTRAPALDFLPPSASMEGFFYPDEYVLPRTTDAYQLLDAIARNFVAHLSNDVRSGFDAQGLDILQAVTLASLVQRESVHTDEQAKIASVFLNRMRAHMSLGSDASVQYALGYNALQSTWWTNPLSAADLQFDSPYNTYIQIGLPPGPIASPGADALHAVANPEVTPFYYFRAKCDGSGYHNFAQTLDEQIANACA